MKSSGVPDQSPAGLLVNPVQSDHDLYIRTKTGDEEAYVALYRRTQGPVFRMALRMSGSATVAEDVTQEVFLALLHEEDRYESSRGSVLAYLNGIARNQVLRRLAQDRPYLALGTGEEETQAEQTGSFSLSNDPLGDLTRGERIESVRQAIQSLPLHYREVVVLCELEELSYAQTAEVLGCSVGTVRSRLHRARGLLLRKLKAADGSDPSMASARPEGCWV